MHCANLLNLSKYFGITWAIIEDWIGIFRLQFDTTCVYNISGSPDRSTQDGATLGLVFNYSSICVSCFVVAFRPGGGGGPGTK